MQVKAAMVEPAEAPYRPMSTLAITGFVLGVLAPLAWFGPVFWIVPALGLIVSALAWRRVASADGELLGLWPARLGVCLSVVCAAVAVGHFTLERYTLATGAKAFADRYLDHVLANELEEAFLDQIDPLSRLTESLDQLYRRKNVFADFRDDPIVHFLSGRGEDAAVAYRGIASIHYQRLYGEEKGSWIVEVAYEVQLSKGTAHTIVVVEGRLAPNREWEGLGWRVLTSHVTWG